MKVFNTVTELQRELKSLDKTIGFVPTMGAIHDGHLSLIKHAKKHAEVVVASIFVNPTQFNSKEDYDKYPRTIAVDSSKFAETDLDYLFIPSEGEIYPKKYDKEYDFQGLDEVMEGKYRPGHFKGVANVVFRLFEIVKPNYAFFGEKDYQQLLIIKKMVEQEKLDIEIISCPIIRENSGLAMSSRNLHLSEKARFEAAQIYKTLELVKQNYFFKSITELENMVKSEIAKQADWELEYFQIARNKDLQLTTDEEKSVSSRAFIVVRVENIRLIDNIVLN